MKRKKKSKIISMGIMLAMVVSLIVGCESGNTGSATGEKLTEQQKEASETTKKKNQEVYEKLDFENKDEFDCAKKGLITAPEELELKDENGKVIWSQKAYAFVEDADAPDTVNPSLWRNTQLNHIYGLFEVTDGIYQVRGYDMSNITFIKGKTGWVCSIR